MVTAVLPTGCRFRSLRMTNPDQLFPENPDDLTPWHPLMGFGWDAVRLARAWHYAGIADVKAMPEKVKLDPSS